MGYNLPGTGYTLEVPTLPSLNHQAVKMPNLPAKPTGMSGAAYKLLGMAVWKGGKLYARRRYGHLKPSRRAAIMAGAGLAALGVVASLASHKGSPDAE